MSKKENSFKMSKRLLNALVKARKLIEDLEHWTFFVAARDSACYPISPNAKEAVCWCALGALRRWSRQESQDWGCALDFAAGIGQAAIKTKGHTLRPAAYVNDVQGHAAVLAMYDRALAIPIGQKIPIPEVS